MTRHRRCQLALGVVAMVVALGLTGCGDDGDDDDGTIPGTTAADAGTTLLEGEVTDRGTEDVTGEGAAPQVEIVMSDNAFSPTFVTAEPGAEVEVSLRNDGQFPHTFTLDDETVDQELDPGDEATVTITVPASGIVPFHCRFHSGSGMQGAFTAGGAGAAPGGGGRPGTTEPPTTAGSSGGGY